MSTHELDGTGKIQLTPNLVLSPLRALHGKVRTAAEGIQEVLGGGADGNGQPSLLPMDDFVPAEPPIELNMIEQIVPKGVLGGLWPRDDARAEVAMLEMQPDPGENACYALLQEIHTPDGTVYDVTLPQPANPMDETLPAVLGGSAPEASESTGQASSQHRMYFPLHRLISDNLPALPETPPDVLGGSNWLEKALDFQPVRRVLRVIKAPIESALLSVATSREIPLRVWTVQPDGTLSGDLPDAEAWRARFDPAREHRVLLYIHGFTSRSERSLPVEWIQRLEAAYDGILAYDHPSITVDPLENARALVEQVPDDVRLHVDMIAHSRGGLVARSLVELQEIRPAFQPRRVLLVGTPNGGAEIADFERWDRFISLGFTTISWLSALGGALVASFTTRGLELVLRAASQSAFDLPGLEAMSPTSNFIRQLNQPTTVRHPVEYAALTAAFQLDTIDKPHFKEALQSMAIQLFLNAPNDLVVRTDSLMSVDLPYNMLLQHRTLLSDVHHHAYFVDDKSFDFARNFLVS